MVIFEFLGKDASKQEPEVKVAEPAVVEEEVFEVVMEEEEEGEDDASSSSSEEGLLFLFHILCFKNMKAFC